MDYLAERVSSVAGRTLANVSERTAASKRQSNNSMEANSFTVSTPFGADSSASLMQPAPIGFVLPRKEVASPAAREVQRPAAEEKEDEDENEDEAELYSGDTWTRIWFLRVLLLSLVRLFVFIGKIYEDLEAAKVYKAAGRSGALWMAAASLLLPTLVFTIYRVAQYLQLALAQLRLTSSSHTPALPPPQHDHEHELQRLRPAASPLPSSAPPTSEPDDSPLVTARQTPVSRPGSTTPTLLPPQAPKLESVEVDKLGALPDKQTTRLVLGASEQLLHGCLFIFWQLKRQVDVLGYLVERACIWRRPSKRELGQLERMRTGADGLEWFQDFYAAFLAILLQVHALGQQWARAARPQAGAGFTQSDRRALDSALAGAGGTAATSSSELSVSGAARALSGGLALGAQSLEGADLLIMSQLLVSMAVVGSLLVAVRRLDDGPLTLALSSLGWASMFASRIIILGLAFVHLDWRLLAISVGLHVLAVGLWIYKIALDSHNEMPSERQFELELQTDESADGSQRAAESAAGMKHTQNWSLIEHVILFAQIIVLFALPSLFYWPIMFNLKFHWRPFKYLVAVLAQNLALTIAVWFAMARHLPAGPTAGQLYLLGAVGALSISGFLFISLYIACKPTLTEYFARADQLLNSAQRAGIYFEFCSRVFKMPHLAAPSFRRLMDQTEELQLQTTTTGE